MRQLFDTFASLFLRRKIAPKFVVYLEGLYTNTKRKIDVVMRLVELYRPYLFFKAIFDDKNTDKLRVAARNSTDSADVFHFQFDPKTIDWEDYMMNVHFPGAVKHLFK
ncbi:unnamed protein product [Rhodiola kirilowii]